MSRTRRAVVMPQTLEEFLERVDGIDSKYGIHTFVNKVFVKLNYNVNDIAEFFMNHEDIDLYDMTDATHLYVLHLVIAQISPQHCNAYSFLKTLKWNNTEFQKIGVNRYTLNGIHHYRIAVGGSL